MPGIIGSTGWDRSRACTWDFSSAHSTTACSGGLRYKPITSQTFPANSGSEDSLKVSARCGLRWKAFQIRPMVDRDKPERSAIDALDQWVASSGVSSSLSTMTFSTCSSVIVGPLPGRYLVTPEQRRGFLVIAALRAGQDDIGPQRQGLR